MLYHGINGYREGDAVSLWERVPRQSKAIKKPTDIDTNPHLMGASSDGCEVADHCLECPLPACRLDDIAGFHWWKNTARRERVLNALREEQQRRRQGAQGRVAKQFGIASRTLARWLDSALKEQAT